VASLPGNAEPTPSGRRRVFDPGSGEYHEATVFQRADLQPGARIDGPALIVEDETTTVVAPAFRATVNALGYLVLERTPREEQPT
jgi:N-methylhydantoinase A